MKKIKLTKGKYALVDDEDFNYLNQWKWHCTYFGYAARRENNKIIYMHRFVNNTPTDMQTDHINENKLDNRNSNLRSCTARQNALNRGQLRHNTSGYKGISKDRGKWAVRVIVNGQNINLGHFNLLTEAIKTYNKAALKYHGEFARLH